MKERSSRFLEASLVGVVPVVLALVANGIFLAALGRDPFTFYSNTLQSGVFEWQGVQNGIIRSAPLLFIAAGLVVAFQSRLWNLGANGQFLLGAAFTAGFAPSLLESVGIGPMLFITFLAAVVAGAIWTLVPSLLRGKYGVNEIVTSLMMSFVGIGVAQLLVKGPFKTKLPGAGARTESIPFSERLPQLFGTRIHLGCVLAVVAMLAVHVLMTRTSLGLKLRVLGANPKAALHSGLNPLRLTVIAFAISGALVGASGWVDILGYEGSFRSEYDPAYGLLVIPLVFLARLNAIGSLFLVIGFSLIEVGGESAARKADLTPDVMLVLVGLVLLMMGMMEYLRARRGLPTQVLPEDLAKKLRAGPPPAGGGEIQPEVGTSRAGS